MALEKVTQGDPDFDWDALALDGYSLTERSELSDKYEGTLNTVAEREVIEGTVISLNKKEVVINIGSKSEGIIPTSEFRYNPELKVGDTVDIFVETQ
jgi:small subunit ribosomal protein S1